MIYDDIIAASTADVSAPSTANEAAIVSYSSQPGRSHIISGFSWSYSTTPTGGNLTIEGNSGDTLFSMDISAGGAGFIQFNFPKEGPKSAPLTVTLAAAGAGVLGKVSVLAHWVD